MIDPTIRRYELYHVISCYIRCSAASPPSRRGIDKSILGGDPDDPTLASQDELKVSPEGYLYVIALPHA